MSLSQHWQPLPPVLQPETGGIAALTARQNDMLALICREDLTYAEVADRFGIAPNTVKNTAHTILSRLGRKTMRGACYDLCRVHGLPVHAMRSESV